MAYRRTKIHEIMQINLSHGSKNLWRRATRAATNILLHLSNIHPWTEDWGWSDSSGYLSRVPWIQESVQHLAKDGRGHDQSPGTQPTTSKKAIHLNNSSIPHGMYVWTLSPIQLFMSSVKYIFILQRRKQWILELHLESHIPLSLHMSILYPESRNFGIMIKHSLTNGCRQNVRVRIRVRFRIKGLECFVENYLSATNHLLSVMSLNVLSRNQNIHNIITHACHRSQLNILFII